MWSVWYYLSSRLGHFGDNATRLCVTDTDSIFQAVERQRSDLELTEIDLLRTEKKEIPFEYSLHAKRFASHIIQTYGKILDWSSISPNNFVYRTLTTNYDQTDDGDAEALAIKTELEFLSQRTRNMPFRVKNEGGDLPLKHCLASSPK